jgi:protein SCO1/2
MLNKGKERKLSKDLVHKIDDATLPPNKEPADIFIQVLIVISMVIATVAIYFLMTSTGATKPGARDNYNSTWSNVGGDFSLTDINGKDYTSASLRGKPNLIYFGFTFCPDICPTELQKISRVLELIAKYDFEVIPVFITIDPERDTPSVMKNYLKHFDRRIVGLTGSPEQIKKVGDMFNVYYEKPKDTVAGDKEYMINHTAYLYVLDRYGKFTKFFDISSHPEEIADFIHANFINIPSVPK